MTQAIDLGKISFLVVDDNDHMRLLVRQILHGLGCGRLREAKDGKSALEQIDMVAPDILVADWVMEPMDGLELTRTIRRSKSSPNPYMPIIIMSGYADLQRVTAARDAGASEFLVKPMSARSLFIRIQTVILHPRPFIKTATYFGPDRRRHSASVWTGDERRRNSPVAVTPPSSNLEAAITQQQAGSGSLYSDVVRA